MSLVASLLILVVSLWLCNAIDALPHLFAGLSMPRWLWLSLGAIVLSWLIKDSPQ